MKNPGIVMPRLNVLHNRIVEFEKLFGDIFIWQLPLHSSCFVVLAAGCFIDPQDKTYGLMVSLNVV